MNNDKQPICIMGLGGGGGNIIDFLCTCPLPGARYVVLDTDIKALARRNEMLSFHLMPTLAKVRSSKCSTLDAARYAWDSREDIKKFLSGTKLLFLVTGLGGGTGSGASPLIAKMAQNMGITSVAMTTLPFNFEGKRRRMIAEESLGIIAKVCHSIFVLKLSQLLPAKPDESFHDIFHRVNAAIYHAVKAAILDFENVDHPPILQEQFGSTQQDYCNKEWVITTAPFLKWGQI